MDKWTALASFVVLLAGAFARALLWIYTLHSRLDVHDALDVRLRADVLYLQQRLDEYLATRRRP